MAIAGLRTRADLAGMAARLTRSRRSTRIAAALPTRAHGARPRQRPVGQMARSPTSSRSSEVRRAVERAWAICCSTSGERLEHVSAGLQLIRQEEPGRCGFVVGKPNETRVPGPIDGGTGHEHHGVVVPLDVPNTSSEPDAAAACRSYRRPAGRCVSSVVRMAARSRVRSAPSWARADRRPFEAASRIARRFVRSPRSMVTSFAASTGDGRRQDRIARHFATKREIKNCVKRSTTQAALDRLTSDTAGFERRWRTRAPRSPGSPTRFIGRKNPSSACKARRAPTDDERRLQQRVDLVGTEISRVKEEIAGLDRAVRERESIARLTSRDGVRDRARRDARARDARDTAKA